MPYMPRYAKHPSHGTCWPSPLWPCWAAAAAAAPRSPAPVLRRTGSPAAAAARWPRRRPPGRTGDLGDAGLNGMLGDFTKQNDDFSRMLRDFTNSKL